MREITKTKKTNKKMMKNLEKDVRVVKEKNS